MAADNHAVWEVYDLLRTCRLTTKYWSVRLLRIRRQDFLLECTLMATAPGSALAGLVFWNTEYGRTAWMLLTTITALLAIVKPLLRLSERLDQLQKIITRYRVIECQLESLTNDIRRGNRYSSEFVAVFKNLEAQVSESSKDEPVERFDEKLRRSLYKEVNEELPLTSFCEPSG